MEDQNLNQENQNQTNNQDPKPKKNPKRVAAGKKGAEARWKRMQTQQEAPAEQQEAPAEQQTVTRVTREPQETESTIVNALAFSGSNYLFSQMGKSDGAEKEIERHDKAV